MTFAVPDHPSLYDTSCYIERTCDSELKGCPWQVVAFGLCKWGEGLVWAHPPACPVRQMFVQCCCGLSSISLRYHPCHSSCYSPCLLSAPAPSPALALHEACSDGFQGHHLH